jgi:hypothetical protein
MWPVGDAPTCAAVMFVRPLPSPVCSPSNAPDTVIVVPGTATAGGATDAPATAASGIITCDALSALETTRPPCSVTSALTAACD